MVRGCLFGSWPFTRCGVERVEELVAGDVQNSAHHDWSGAYATSGSELPKFRARAGVQRADTASPSAVPVAIVNSVSVETPNIDPAHRHGRQAAGVGADFDVPKLLSRLGIEGMHLTVPRY